MRHGVRSAPPVLQPPCARARAAPRGAPVTHVVARPLPAPPVLRATPAARTRVCAHAAQNGNRAASAAVLQAPAAAPPAAASATLANTDVRRLEALIPRGETGGAALLVENVSIQAGDRDLMADVSWRVMPGQRVGLVGANGAGKSTLLKCLCGVRGVDSGRVVLAPSADLAYLEQVGVGGSQRTVWEEARSRMTHLLDAEAAIEAAVRDAEAGVPNAAEALLDAQAAFENAGGYDADKRIANVLTGLGFKQTDFSRAASSFSGGWQMRIALARTLLSPAGEASRSGKDSGGILMLDEPTNHLDNAACTWLADFLRSSGGTVIIVSHDEALLETCTHIAEVRGGSLHHFTGTFSEFLAARKLREEQALAAAMSAQAEIARTEAFMAKFGAKTAFAAQAKSREKMLNRLRENAGELPVAAAASGGGDRTKSSMKFPPPPPCHRELVIMKEASVGWAGTPLLSEMNLTIEKGQRILVLGPNGAGKSTLLKSIAGTEPLISGTRRMGEGAKLAVFAQDLAQELPLEQPALDYVLDTARKEDSSITTEMGRKALGALGLIGESALRPIGQLSGGEKSRVALATFALNPVSLMMLDEPSNHLDATTIDTLATALQAYEGAVLVITHNKMFASRLNATHILRVEAGKATLKPNIAGTLSDADFDAAKPAAQAAGLPRKTPKKQRAPSPDEEMEALRAAARQERYALAGNSTAESDSKPKSKNERMAAKRDAEAKAKADKQAAKKRVPR